MTDIKSLQIEIEHRRDHAKHLEARMVKAEASLAIAKEALTNIATAAEGATLYITYDRIRDIARHALQEIGE